MTPSRIQRSARPAGLALLSLLCAAFLLPVLLAGCGGGGADGDSVILTVGDRDVTAAYYELKLGKLAREELPVDENGETVDTSTMAGKKAFLDVITNKELMAAKAVDLGYGSSESVMGINNAVREVEGGKLMHLDLIETPTANVTEQDVLDYYEMSRQERRLMFMICDMEQDALAARERILAGDPWKQVADEFNTGSKGPAGDYSFVVHYGQTSDEFEEAVFGLEVGEVSRPVKTIYGFWILRVEAVRDIDVPELTDEYRTRIESTIKGRRINLARQKFVAESRERHEYKMDEESLRIIYQGLPEDELYLDPETQSPVDKGLLEPLKIDRKDLNRFFMSCRLDLDKEPESWTIGDYKNLFDDMNTFQRPKKNTNLGGVRNKIETDMVDRRLLVSEARERGYLDDPRVVAQGRQRSEQAMITRLHDEVVKIEDVVSPEELSAFWDEHRGEYKISEARSGRIIYCAEESVAAEAAAAARSGSSWKELLASYGQNKQNIANEGVVEPLPAHASGRIRDAFYGLAAIGDISDPVALDSGFAVVRLDEITPERMMELSEVREGVAERIRRQRKDAALNELLDEWRQEFPVVVNEKNLAKVRSWEELTAAE